MPFGLSDETIAQIRGVFARHPQIEKAILYGSRAKGNHKPGSDIDLTLTGAGLTLARLHQINTELDDLLLPYTIDLSIHHQINNPDFLDHIARVGVRFYVRDDGGAGITSLLPADLDIGKRLDRWKEVRLSDVCVKVLTGGTPSTRVSEYYMGGNIPWLKTKEVNFCRVNNSTFAVT